MDLNLSGASKNTMTYKFIKANAILCIYNICKSLPFIPLHSLISVMISFFREKAEIKKKKGNYQN